MGNRKTEKLVWGVLFHLYVSNLLSEILTVYSFNVVECPRDKLVPVLTYSNVIATMSSEEPAPCPPP